MNIEKEKIIKRAKNILAELDRLEQPGAGKKVLKEMMKQVKKEDESHE